MNGSVWNWIKPRLGLLVALLVLTFVFLPDASTRAVYCGFGMTSHCSPSFEDRLKAARDEHLRLKYGPQ